MAGERVLLGVSGGIDSGVAAYLLREQGYEVVGLHMVMVDGDMPLACERSEAIAAQLDIPVHIYDARALFRSDILDPFVDSYMRGETPSPCTWCNRVVKWRVLQEAAVLYGCTRWATGHYCQIVESGARLYVERGRDPLKDQSYYLWALDQEVLRGALMPLGGYLKSEIRQIASRIEGVASLTTKPESMGLCFLKGRGYRALIEEYHTLQCGDIVDTLGEKIGTHDGYPFYTIAQKRGLDIPKGMCVIGVDAESNRVVVGDDDQLYHRDFLLRDWVATDVDELLSSPKVEVKVRGIGRNPDGYCTVVRRGDLLSVNCSSPAWALAVGQPAVFYIGNRVIGGGYLTL